MYPLVYIVVLNYNGAIWLKNCLESLGATGYHNFRILLVDNASSDDSVRLIGEMFPDLASIINPINYGFSAGNNLGIGQALGNGADYVVLLNPDTRVEPDWLTHLIEIGESEPGIGILGSAQLTYEDYEFNGWTKIALRDHLEELKRPEQARRWIPVDWVEGACFAVKRAVFEKIGLLDPIYFAFYEEIDFCRRAACQGYQTALVPLSLIHHHRGGSWRANPEIERKRDYHCDRSQFIFNLTDPRRSVLGNLYWYLITLATKGKESIYDLSPSRAWDLLRMQLEIVTDLGALHHKWRRDRLNS
ncbi:MAG TPA: glycosyltransferase family 2 protein [Blastocatellia bacterium]|nr:glycosyltransferase family 2 protein [Blastocatellia bacterium]